ncbi:hypothetical protein ACFFRR_003752 [Megaselia abdita]
MEQSIAFDEQNKIWSRSSKNNGVPLNSLIGPAILNRLKEMDKDKVLEINHANGRETTVKEMYGMSVTCAKNLVNLGIQQGDIVAIIANLTYYTTPLCFGCFIQGAIVNPIPVTSTDEGFEHIMSYINPKIIIYETCFKDRIEKAIEKVKPSNLEYFICSNNDIENILFKPVDDIDSFTAPDLGDPSKIIAAMPLTSGSTGKQKAIQISHSFYMFGMMNWFESFKGMRYYIGSNFGWMSQIAALAQPVFIEQVRIYSDNQPSGEYMAQVIYDTKATHFFSASFAVPDLIEYCIANEKVHYLASLRKLLTGGAPIPQALYKEIETLLPNCQFICGYGMTEMNGTIATDERLTNRDGVLLIPGLQLRILDTNRNPVGRNSMGKIELKPLNVNFLGYHNMDEVNKESFVDGWISTGDYGAMNDQNLLNVFGRYKDLIFCDEHVVRGLCYKKNEPITKQLLCKHRCHIICP